MKGPSIAVMLGGGHDEAEESGEPGRAEAESSAKDGAKALIQAVASKNPDAVYRAFRALCGLCKEIDDLEESGEHEEEAEAAEHEAEPKEEE